MVLVKGSLQGINNDIDNLQEATNGLTKREQSLESIKDDLFGVL
jgi:hypothetical protein